MFYKSSRRSKTRQETTVAFRTIGWFDNWDLSCGTMCLKTGKITSTLFFMRWHCIKKVHYGRRHEAGNFLRKETLSRNILKKSERSLGKSEWRTIKSIYVSGMSVTILFGGDEKSSIVHGWDDQIVFVLNCMYLDMILSKGLKVAR